MVEKESRGKLMQIREKSRVYVYYRVLCSATTAAIIIKQQKHDIRFIVSSFFLREKTHYHNNHFCYKSRIDINVVTTFVQVICTLIGFSVLLNKLSEPLYYKELQPILLQNHTILKQTCIKPSHQFI